MYTSFKKSTYLCIKFLCAMVQSKTELFDIELQESAELFKALSHPARLTILKYLAETRTCITGDITEEVPLGRTTVNQHLKELKKVGLINGSKTNYCLNGSRIAEFREIVMKLFKDFNKGSNNFCC
jgi:ArsR family transcriptional regulator